MGAVGFVKGFYGGVSADEPRAALAGRDVLTAGGSAADAATAIYFMLSVTMPSAAGLGGGGMCLVRDPGSQKVETLDFLGQPSSGPGAKVMVPGNPRGIFALHAKFGRLDWRELIRPAENVARFGGNISRAFAEDMQRGANQVLASPYGRQVYADTNGNLRREGAAIRQPDLAATLALIRARGAGAIYTGASARELAEGAARVGVGITYSDLKAYLPIWRSTIRVPFVEATDIHFPMPRTPQGTLGAKMSAALVTEERYQDAAEQERGHLISEAIQRAAADGARGFKSVTVERQVQTVESKFKWATQQLSYTQIDPSYAERLMQGYSAGQLVELAKNGLDADPQRLLGGETSFSVVDITGGAVACSLTMNGSFGTGKVLPGTGVFLANHAEVAGLRDLSLGAVIVDHRLHNTVFLAGSASGGPASQAVLAQVTMAATLRDGSSLEQDIAKRDRVFRDVAQRITYVEQGAATQFVNDLKRRGHRVSMVPGLSRVNMAFCDRGLPAKDGNTTCAIHTDPRGFGFATTPG